MLRSVYKGGSSVILPNPKDIDYFYFYDTNEERVEALIENTDHSVDKHFRLWEKRLRIFVGCHAYPFMEHIAGEEIPELKTFNICDHKEEYKVCAKRFMERYSKTYKGWYHLYIASCMFNNDKNELTKDQKKKAQAIHDNGIMDKQIAFIKRVLNI